ncbi:MAG: element excision factor XisH family protein [Hormoscilla sp.]
MSAKDRFHDAVKTGLIKEGWKITHDPLYLYFDNTRVTVYLAGEKLLAAERNFEKIAVEVNNFIAPSTIDEFYLAVGQGLSYRIALGEQEPERQLYLAVPIFIYQAFFRFPLAQKTIQEAKLSIIIYEADEEAIVQWIS